MSENIKSSPTEHSPLLSPPAEPSDPVPPAPAESQPQESTVTLKITRLRATGIIASTAILLFFQATNFSLLTTTQSTIAEALDAFDDVSWFTSAYLISMSSVSPLAGRLSQIFSPRWLILVTSTVFAVGSIVTSRANNLAVFLLGRTITGIGAAGCLTLTIILVVSLAPKERRGLFFGLVNTSITTGVSLGAVLGGALLEPLGWRGLFWVQAPFAFLAGVGVFFALPSNINSTTPASAPTSLRKKLLSIDYAGAILLTSTIVLLLVGLSSPWVLWTPIGASFGLLVFFVLNEAYLASHPVIPVTLLSSRGALLTCGVQLGAMMARWLVLFYTPVYALAVRGWSPPTAGSILIPTNAGFAAGGLLAGMLHIRRGGSFYLATIVSFTFFPITLGVLAYFSTRDSPVVWVIVATFLNGFTTGAFLNYTLAHLLHLTRPEDHPVATSVLGTFRGFAGSFGSAIGGGVFVRILRPSLEEGFKEEGLKGREDLVRKLLGQPALVRTLAGVEKEVARQGYVDAIRGLFLAGVALSAVMIILQAGTGWKSPGLKSKVVTLGEEDDDDDDDDD